MTPIEGSQKKKQEKSAPQTTSETPQSSTETSKRVFEVDKSRSLEWSVYEHAVIDGKIVSTTLICRDIKPIARRKLELAMFSE